RRAGCGVVTVKLGEIRDETVVRGDEALNSRAGRRCVGRDGENFGTGRVGLQEIERDAGNGVADRVAGARKRTPAVAAAERHLAVGARLDDLVEIKGGAGAGV